MLNKWVCFMGAFILTAHAEILFNIGTPENPTMDNEYINKPYLSKDLPISKIPKINMTPSQHETKDERKIARLLAQAALGGKLAYVLKTAKQYNLPASVALIPIVESNYNTNALSPKGAAGLWQLSSAVSKDYEFPLEQRNNWKASTHVALRHIKNLYQHYQRWDLVWAAYNAGQHRVDKASQTSPQTSAETLSLPQETKNYVLKLSHLKQMLLQI